jgi:hypothetical protein
VMNDLVHTYVLLAAGLRDDPLLSLAQAVASLDPLWQMGDDEDWDEEGDGLSRALSITRTAFPDLYAGAIQRIRAGATDHDLDRYLCSEITRRGRKQATS